MLKVFVALCLVAGIVGFIQGPFNRPSSVLAATNQIKATTASVQQAAKESSAKASALGSSLQAREAAIPDRLREFIKTTERLTTLRERLVADSNEYRNVVTAALAKFDSEAQGIKEPSVTRDMTILRRKTEEEQNTTAQNAIETISLLDDVLLRGSDLQHAANCIMIAKDIHSQGEALDAQMLDARQSANAYQQTTNTLLSKITVVLAEAK